MTLTIEKTDFKWQVASAGYTAVSFVTISPQDQKDPAFQTFLREAAEVMPEIRNAAHNALVLSSSLTVAVLDATATGRKTIAFAYTGLEGEPVAKIDTNFDITGLLKALKQRVQPQRRATALTA